MIENEAEVIEYEKIICTNEDKGEQICLVINTFRNQNYLHFRKYFMSFDEGWLPSREGVSMVMTIENIQNILDGLFEVCAKAEAHELLNKYRNPQ